MNFHQPALSVLAAALALATSSAFAQSSPKFQFKRYVPTLQISEASQTPPSSEIPVMTPGGESQVGNALVSAQAGQDFGSVTVGSSATRSFTVSNTGSATTGSLVLTVQGSGLSLSANTCGTVAAPGSLAPNTQCAVTVRFAPTEAGALSGSLTVASNVPTSPSVFFLTGTAAQAPAADPNWTGVTLLLGGGTTAGATAFTDESPAGTTVTRYGNTVARDTVVKAGPTAIYFDGAGDYLRADASLASLTTTGASWTMEAWVYPTGHGHVFGANRKSDGANTMLIATTAATLNGPTIYDYPDFPLNQWSHLAAAYDGTTLRVFRDGTQIYSRTYAVNNQLSNTVLGIGAEFDTANGGTPGNYFTGYMDEIRVTPGTARYVANFTLPSAPWPRQ